jgi:dipeptidyl aminopeptidase/acylaminoacyl peptidase
MAGIHRGEQLYCDFVKDVCVFVQRRMKNKNHKLFHFLLFMGLFLGITGFTGIRAQDAMPLPVEQALRLQQLANLMPVSLSPDGQWLAYTVQENWAIRPGDVEMYLRTGVPPWSSGTHIELVNTETGRAENLTEGSGNSWLPTWSPNGGYLAFLSDRQGGKAQLWIWDRARRTFRRVSGVIVRGNQIEWTPDSEDLLVMTYPEGNESKDSYRSSPSVDGDHATTNERTSSLLLYESGKHAHGAHISPTSRPWDLDVYLHDLTEVDRSDSKLVTLTDGERIAAYSISPNGSAIAYTVPERFEKPGSQQILFDLRVLRLSAKQDNVIASDEQMENDGRAFSWSPDSAQLSFCTGGMDVKVPDCYMADVRNGSLHNVSKLSSIHSAEGLSQPLWDNKGHIYFAYGGKLWRAGAGQDRAAEVGCVRERRIVHMIPWLQNLLWTMGNGPSTVVLTHDDSGKQDGFYRINLRTGRSEKILEQGQCYTCANLSDPFAASKDGREMAYAAEDAAHDEDLWMSTGNAHAPRRLTHLNPQFDHYKLGTARLIDWLSDDGRRLQGALLLPSNYRKGKRYPLIVWVYGGSLLSNDLDHFGLAGSGPFNMQLFATRGYAVLLPDAPEHVGTPLADLAKTVLPGVNKVVEMGIADPHRLAVAGHSYGGYCVLGLIVQTGRFKAAAEMDGSADLIGNYGEMTNDGSAFGVAWIEAGQGSMAGTLWQDRNSYIENSPIFYLNRVTTPLLIVQGADDRTVAPFLGDEVFVGLRRLGKEAQYAKYEGEGHSPLQWSYRDQADLCRRLIAWFDAHLHAAGLE